jgi:hypothetical protein
MGTFKRISSHHITESSGWEEENIITECSGWEENIIQSSNFKYFE